MKKKAASDFIVLLLVFITAWELKSALPTGLQGPSVLVLVSIISLVIMKLRRLSFAQIGFEPRAIDNSLLREVFLVAGLIFIIQFVGLVVIGSLMGNPEQGTAVTAQPKTILDFIVDIVFTTWLIIGIGEEFFFRGILMNRLKELCTGLKFADNKITVVASAIQAIWFGAAHPSQGVSGMLIAGLIGFGLGIYFFRNRKKGLWPLAIAHGLIDTVVLTLSFLQTG